MTRRQFGFGVAASAALARSVVAQDRIGVPASRSATAIDSSQAPPPMRSLRAIEIANWMARQNVPGLAACIAKGDKVVWQSGYGMADMTKRVPFTPDQTFFHIASISKTMTATAVMQLRDRGLFDLDEDVGKFVNFPVHNPRHPEQPITFKHLLTHTSSIDDSDAIDSTYSVGDPSMSLDEVVTRYFTASGSLWSRRNYARSAPRAGPCPARAPRLRRPHALQPFRGPLTSPQDRIRAGVRRGAGRHRACRVRAGAEHPQGSQPEGNSTAGCHRPDPADGLGRMRDLPRAMTLRTGTSKTGKVHRYYTCSSCARQGSTACKGRSIRMDKLDSLVTTHLADRLLEPRRLTALLASVAGRQAEKAATLNERLRLLEQEAFEADERLRRLYTLVEEGSAVADDVLQDRIRALRADRDRARAALERAQAAARPPVEVSPIAVEQFGRTMRENLTTGEVPFRKTYLGSIVDRVEVDDSEIRIVGRKDVLERAILAKGAPIPGVRSFVRKWRSLGESNPSFQIENLTS